MIISFIVAIPVIALLVWFYLKICPSGTTLKSRLGFETSVLTAGILGCILVSYFSYSTVGQGTDSAWWPVIALIYCFVLIPSILILSAIKYNPNKIIEGIASYDRSLIRETVWTDLKQRRNTRRLS